MNLHQLYMAGYGSSTWVQYRYDPLLIVHSHFLVVAQTNYCTKQPWTSKHDWLNIYMIGFYSLVKHTFTWQQQ